MKFTDVIVYIALFPRCIGVLNSVDGERTFMSIYPVYRVYMSALGRDINIQKD